MGIVPPFALGLMSSSVFHPLEERLVALLPGVGVTATWSDNFVLLFLTAASIALLAYGLSRGMHEVRAPTPVVERRQFFAREAFLPTVVNFFLHLTFASYTTFLPLYARTFGLGNAGYLYSIYALAILSTRALGARVGDRYGRTAVIVPGLGAILLALLVLAFAPNGRALYLGVSLYGLGFGLSQPGLNAFVIDRLAPERRGLGMSTFGQGLDLGMGLGGILMGSLASHFGFPLMYLCGSGCVCLSLAIFLWGNHTVRR
jgi:MFS family permease